MNFILQAGPLLWPIVLCSVVGFAIFLDRAYVLYRHASGQRELVPEVVSLVAQGRFEAASTLCRRNRGPIANVLGTSLRTRDLSSEEREQIVTVSGNRELHNLERGLRGIAVIARIAPLLGLLGTVVGLVEAFLAVSTMQGPPDPSVLASGIWQALLTTVAGLVVAIPAIVSHEWLQSRIDALALAMEEALAEVSSLASPSPAPEARSGDA